MPAYLAWMADPTTHMIELTVLYPSKVRDYEFGYCSRHKFKKTVGRHTRFHWEGYSWVLGTLVGHKILQITLQSFFKSILILNNFVSYNSATVSLLFSVSILVYVAVHTLWGRRFTWFIWPEYAFYSLLYNILPPQESVFILDDFCSNNRDTPRNSSRNPKVLIPHAAHFLT